MTAQVVLLGGGLSSMAAAWALTEAGVRDVTILEQGPRLGGLAGSFEADGNFYPLGYHHILHRDRTLLFVLKQLGILDDVRWRRIRVLFHHAQGLSELGTPLGFLRFPMSIPDKARFVHLMLRAFAKREWHDWDDASAAELVDRWAGPGVRKAIFEPLARLRFDRPCEEISGSWLGQRLHYREGSAPLGYLPGTNWTTTLCERLAARLERNGVKIRLGARIADFDRDVRGLREVRLADGERVAGTHFLNGLPAEIYCGLAPEDHTAALRDIRYSAMISVVCATRQPVPLDFYWMNMATLDRTASGIFRLDSLNPTIGAPDEACINFVTHLRDRYDPLFHTDEEELISAYCDDFQRATGEKLDPHWTHVSRVPLYAPAYVDRYRNPPVRSTTHRNLWFAGNYRAHPTPASTGTAMASGFEAARDLLRAEGLDTDLPERADAFRLAGMPRR